MQTPHKQSPKKKLSKYKNSDSQFRAFRKYLAQHTATCSVAAKDLDIPQKCLTRYKRRLEKAGKLIELFHGICPITGFPAAFLTTNPLLIKSSEDGEGKI